MKNFPRSNKAVEFWAGFRDTFPLVVGAAPFGIIFGALAVNSGLSAWAAAGMSSIVFAGSSQFIAVGLISQGALPALIIFTTFIVNLRHGLYATTLGPHMRHLPTRWLMPLGFWLTDETFVVAARRYSQQDDSKEKHWYYLGSAVFMYLNWQLVTWVGILVGKKIPNAADWGLDYAMLATFIAMLVPMLVNSPTMASMVIAGAVAIIFHGLPNQIGLLAGILAGILAGVILDAIKKGETR